MTREIPLNRELLSFEGKSFNDGKLTVKSVLLTYLRSADKMGADDAEQNNAYVLGHLIAISGDKILLNNSEYDTIKKLCDNGKITFPGEQTRSYFSLEVKLQIKQIVDDAPQVEETLPVETSSESQVESETPVEEPTEPVQDNG